MHRLRALLILGRVSNLPTVWSNCLAGWWLGGAGFSDRLPLLFAGGTFLYVGGMFLNDAFDEEFDRLHRKERPIPAGVISAKAVWRWGIAWLIAGIATWFALGWMTGVLGVILAASIVLYDAVHKRVSFAPLLMALCRFWLYLAAAAVGTKGITTVAVAGAIALGAYIVGISYLARRESTGGVVTYWPLALLVAPPVVAISLSGFREPVVLISLVFILWVVRSIRPVLRSTERGHWPRGGKPFGGYRVRGLAGGGVWTSRTQHGFYRAFPCRARFAKVHSRDLKSLSGAGRSWWVVNQSSEYARPGKCVDRVHRCFRVA